MPLSEFMLRDDEYLHWVKSRKPAAWNLVTSGLLKVEWCELGLDSGELQITGHSPYGYHPLLERLAFRYGTRPANVLTSLGTSGANFLALAALVEPGDRVLMESPTYEPMYRAAEFLGARLEFFERRFEDGYAIDPDRVARAITPDTRVVFISNLHNPSGRFTGEQTMLDLGRVAAKTGAYVLADEVYQEFVPNARPAFHLGDNFISTNSLTKVYGMGGLRCGWVLAHENVIERCRRVTNIAYGETPLVSDIAGCRALDRIDWLADRSRKLVAANRALVDAFIERHRDRVEWVAPDGGTICFPRLKQGSGNELARIACEKYDTDVAAGRFFEGPRGTGACERHVRISYGGEARVLEEGLTRLGHAMGELTNSHKSTTAAH